jgi:hypothetical protein
LGKGWNAARLAIRSPLRAFGELSTAARSAQPARSSFRAFPACRFERENGEQQTRETINADSKNELMTRERQTLACPPP